MDITTQAKRIAAGDKAGFMVARAYRYWRALNYPASEALARARRDAEAETPRYAERGLASYGNAPNSRGGRFIESPALAGLRFVGWSHELLRLNYTGWLLAPEGDGDLARGCVYQLPSRRGLPCYVEAVRLGDESRKRGWQDQCGSRHGPAIVYLGERHLGERGEDSPRDSDACWDAARGADSEAESIAEREREWQEAWRAGRDLADKIEGAQSEAAAARSLARSIARNGHIWDDSLRGHVWREVKSGLMAAGCSRREALEEIADSPFNRTRHWGDNDLRLAFFEGLGEPLPEEESESCG